MFCLQPNKIVEVSLKFKHPNPTNVEEWPNIMEVIQSGKLTITYANGKE